MQADKVYIQPFPEPNTSNPVWHFDIEDIMPYVAILVDEVNAADEVTCAYHSSPVHTLNQTAGEAIPLEDHPLLRKSTRVRKKAT